MNSTEINIGWAHKNVPRIFGLLSFAINPVFVYLVFTEKTFGNYKYLILYFCIFNVIYSTFDMLVPVAIHEYRYAYIAFVANGWFTEISNFHVIMFSVRCCLVSSCYSILVSHFIYRYFIILGSSYTREHFRHFISFSITLLAAYFTVWAATLKSLRGNNEIREYIKDDFCKEFGVDIHRISMFFFLYKEGSPETILRSYVGVTILIGISGVSLFICVIFGIKIVKYLNGHATSISKRTADMQKKLLFVLVIQTVIPTLVSFLPCFIAWLSPIFRWHLGRIFNVFGAISVSVFPFLDTLAIVFCLPAIRKRFSWKRLKKSQISTVYTPT